MSRRPPTVHVVMCLWLIAAVGCQPQQPFYLFEDGDLSHYKGMATEIDVPDVDLETLADVRGASAPLSLTNTQPTEIWELTLEEAMQIALANSKVMRSLGAVSGTPTSITQSPDVAPTIYDPARTETNPRFGTEAALAAFDTQFEASVFWDKSDTPRNSPPSIVAVPVLQEDLGTFQAKLSKINATGGTTSISHNWEYSCNNQPNFVRLWPSNWNVDVTAEFRQPLLQGAGVQFNRIAGPAGIPGYYNGVVIARLKTDVSLTEFESAVRNLVRDVEQAYWNLHLAYRELDSVIAGRDSALETWRKTHALFELGARGGEAEKEAQTREQYFLFLSYVEEQLSNLYAAETQLRYMMGLAATDGRLIRPSDEPTWAKLSFDWQESQCEAMVRNVDIRRQKWRVKEKEMELIAAKNFVLPRLDAVGTYKWLGMGHDLIEANRDPVTLPPFYDDAFESLTSGNYQGWQLGMELTIPIGFRKELAGVRNAQLNLARERTILREEELEVSHQLTASIRELDKGYVLSRTNFNRRIAAKKQVEAVSAAYENGTVTMDLLLQSQRRLAEAEVAFYRSVIDYNMAIVDVHYRKGSLLEYNGVYLAEGPWPGKAYFDARRRARARDAGIYLDYGFTRPRVISRGPYAQHVGQAACPAAGQTVPEDGGLTPESIPTPAPEQPLGRPLLEAPPVPEDDGIREAARPETDGPSLSGSGGVKINQLADLFDTSAHGGHTAWRAAGTRQVSCETAPGGAPWTATAAIAEKPADDKNWTRATTPSSGNEPEANTSRSQTAWHTANRQGL